MPWRVASPHFRCGSRFGEGQGELLAEMGNTVRRGLPTYVYIDNHYIGHAPATGQQFREMWKKSL